MAWCVRELHGQQCTMLWLAKYIITFASVHSARLGEIRVVLHSFARRIGGKQAKGIRDGRDPAEW